MAVIAMIDATQNRQKSYLPQLRHSVSGALTLNIWSRRRTARSQRTVCPPGVRKLEWLLGFGLLAVLPRRRQVQAMPIILTEPADIESWMAAPWAEKRALQRPPPDGGLVIVARGERRDGPGNDSA